MERESILSELSFKAVRSPGKGGQHINKVATKVELRFDLEKSIHFTKEEKFKLIKTLKSKLTKDNTLVLQCSETRSQLKNKQLVIQKFFQLIEEGLNEQKQRIPTKTPKSVKVKRLTNKKRLSDKKISRQKPKLD